MKFMLSLQHPVVGLLWPGKMIVANSFYAKNVTQCVSAEERDGFRYFLRNCSLIFTQSQQLTDIGNPNASR